jgi:hypothetical protein
MKTLLIAISILAMIGTVLATLTAVVFCLGMGANAKPPEIRTLKLWMLGLTLLGTTGITVGIFLLRAGLPGWAAGVSFAPTVIFGLILAIALLK